MMNFPVAAAMVTTVLVAGMLQAAGTGSASGVRIGLQPGVISGAAEESQPDDVSPSAVIDAGDKAALLGCLGEEVTVRGRLQRIGALSDEFIIFLNFAGNSRGDFCGIVRKADLPALRLELGEEFPYNLEGKLIELRGPVTDYKGTPQIEVKSAGQISVAGDE